METSFFQYKLLRGKLNVSCKKVDKFKAGTITQEKADNVCMCPIDFKEICSLKTTSKCESERFLFEYLVNNKAIPSISTNKFVILKPKNLKYQYRYVLDHEQESKKK